MRRYGLYDVTRGLTAAFAAAVAGLLLWLATQVGQQTTGRFWGSMGIVAGAGLALALTQVIGGWTKGLKLRLSPSTLLLGVLPVLVCVGWILLATQPAGGEGTIVSWSHTVGLMGVIHALGLWHGALAFGFGLVLGYSVDAVPAPPPAAKEAVAIDRAVADEPMAAERPVALGLRYAQPGAEPNTVVVGPRTKA